jgi:TctA family transporter
MTLGIPGDVVMALLLGALIIKGIQPGPQLITEHPDIFWGLIASFWIGNALLVVLNVPLIGVWVRLLRVPYRLLFPAATFFLCLGVYSMKNSLFDVAELVVFGAIGALFMALEIPVAPIVLGFVLGPLLEENFRRALELSRGDLTAFVAQPISATFVAACALLLLVQIVGFLRRARAARSPAAAAGAGEADARQRSA